jgi:hypothetical protein
MTAISGDVLDVLKQCETDGLKLVLPGQLDRKMYEEVNKTLDAAGGKWNRRAGGHLFADPAGQILAAMVESGQVTGWREQGWFPTPPAVVELLLDFAELEPGMEVLEPSAGEGAIVRPVAALGCIVDCIELDDRRAEKLRGDVVIRGGGGHVRRVSTMDFLEFRGWDGGRYDRVVMNPPFAGDADLRHVLHAEAFLRPGGRLVAVMAGGAEFRQDRKWVAFRALVEARGGWITRLPDDSFKQSGTGVRTVVVVLPAREART